MAQIVFLWWFMMAVLPFYMLLHGYEALNKHCTKRGIDFGVMHYILLILIILFIAFTLAGYRL